MFESLQEHFGSILSSLTGRGTLSEKDVSNALQQLQDVLIDADVSFDVVQSFTQKIQEKAVGEEVLKSIKPGQMVIKIVHDELVALLGSENQTINLQAPAPVIIMLVGLQGAGKTTTAAKIARRLTIHEKKKVLMASLDTYRPAAQEQLSVLGEQVNVATLPIIPKEEPIQIALRAVQSAKTGGYDVLIIDTAGRTHNDHSSMEEMVKIKEATAPHEILLVADSLTGQNAVNLAIDFDRHAGITGIILTRMDSNARSGAAFSMRAVTGKPIKLIASGEKMDALEEFHPKRMADRILGMGDIVSLVEKARENINEEKAEKLSKKIKSGHFDLDDLADQLEQMQKMGGLGKIMSLIPGMAGMKDKLSMAGFDDKTIRQQLAVISSMTKEERQKPEILKHSRKKRISLGAGTNAAEINKVLKMHRSMADAMKLMKDKKGLSSLLGGSTPLGQPNLGNIFGQAKNILGAQKQEQPSFEDFQKLIKNENNAGALFQNFNSIKPSSPFSSIKSMENKKKK